MTTYEIVADELSRLPGNRGAHTLDFFALLITSIHPALTTRMVKTALKKYPALRMLDNGLFLLKGRQTP